jgi:trigger factor
MQYTLKDLPKSQKDIRVTVPPDELKPFMEKAAQELSQRVKIEGFRPGKASYDVVAKRFGEMAVLEEALPAVVQKFLVEIVAKEKLETVGEPSIDVEKAAPGNEAVFRAKVTLLPKVEKLADVRKIRIEAKDAAISDAEVEKVVSELRKMQSTEREVEREARAEDKITVDMAMSLDKVPVEGGAAKGHAIYLAEPYYVPGLNEKLLGMKKGENRLFTLKFPKEHFNRQLAGKEVEFSVDLKGVHEISHPEADDAFAKSLGKETMAELRALLRKNLEEEAVQKETQRQEIAVLEELMKQSKFGEIPDLLVHNETHKMVHELEHSVGRQGVPFDEYLKNIKKTKEQLMLDFAPEAVKRVKGTILIREISKRENLAPDDKEVLDEQMKMLNRYRDDAKTQERIRSEEGESYIRIVLTNRKTLEFLRKAAVRA